VGTEYRLISNFVDKNGASEEGYKRTNSDGSVGGIVAVSAQVDETAVIEEGAYVGPGAIIKANAIIRSGAEVAPNETVEEGVELF
jgi:NDP-sugar pyrophosphorylase family protein